MTHALFDIKPTSPLDLEPLPFGFCVGFAVMLIVLGLLIVAIRKEGFS